MNLTKTEFKAQYSEYRRKLNESYLLGKDAFVNQMNSNSIFSEISLKTVRPVSLKIWIYKHS